MQKIVIISTSIDDWGGSEELWGRSIPYLQHAGFKISVMKYAMDKEHPELKKLHERDVNLIEINTRGSVTNRILKTATQFFETIAIKLKLSSYRGEDFSQFIKLLTNESPSLAIISQGINFDGLKLAHQCLLLKIPYVIISQKAVDFYWPHQNDRTMMLETLLNAKKSYFVSHHNLRLTEEQFGKRLPNGQVIFNPVKLSGEIVPYPAANENYKLACIGRLFLLDKGQDILIRILAEQKWRDRPVMVSFIGKGVDEQALKDMAALLNVTNVEFRGQVEDIGNMWIDYHALLLPSRCEGLPLSMVEAMSAGRPVIISDAGGNTELVDEGITGYIGYANEESFGDAMERAWQNRNDWEQIGKNAAKHISSVVPKSPESDFAAAIQKIINNS